MRDPSLALAGRAGGDISAVYRRRSAGSLLFQRRMPSAPKTSSSIPTGEVAFAPFGLEFVGDPAGTRRMRFVGRSTSLARPSLSFDGAVELLPLGAMDTLGCCHLRRSFYLLLRAVGLLTLYGVPMPTVWWRANGTGSGGDTDEGDRRSAFKGALVSSAMQGGVTQCKSATYRLVRCCLNPCQQDGGNMLASTCSNSSTSSNPGEERRVDLHPRLGTSKTRPVS